MYHRATYAQVCLYLDGNVDATNRRDTRTDLQVRDGLQDRRTRWNRQHHIGRHGHFKVAETLAAATGRTAHAVYEGCSCPKMDDLFWGPRRREFGRFSMGAFSDTF